MDKINGVKTFEKRSSFYLLIPSQGDIVSTFCRTPLSSMIFQLHLTLDRDHDFQSKIQLTARAPTLCHMCTESKQSIKDLKYQRTRKKNAKSPNHKNDRHKYSRLVWVFSIVFAILSFSTSSLLPFDQIKICYQAGERIFVSLELTYFFSI